MCDGEKLDLELVHAAVSLNKTLKTAAVNKTVLMKH